MTKTPKSNFFGFSPNDRNADDPNGQENDAADGETAGTEMDMDDPHRRPKVQEEHCSQSEEDFWRGL